MQSQVLFLCPGLTSSTHHLCLSLARLCFRSQVKGETERERLLLAYQVNDEVQQGHFPVNKELALEVAALMAQVWSTENDSLAFLCLVFFYCISFIYFSQLFGIILYIIHLNFPSQVENGDLEKPASFSPSGSSQPKSQLILLQALDRFYPKRYKQDCNPEQLR